MCYLAPVADSLVLDPKDYPGGIALWGALPAVLDTTEFPAERGVHVHARRVPGGEKQIDQTFLKVHVVASGRDDPFEVSGEDGVAYNIAAILGVPLRMLECSSCGVVLRDHVPDCIRPRKEHKCPVCSSVTHTDEPCVANPLMMLKSLCGDGAQSRPMIDRVDRTMNVNPARFRAIQFWGSNPAIVWTSPKLEEGGIHFHGYLKTSPVPDVDETYGYLSINRQELDPRQVRVYMAQRSVVKSAVVALDCPACGRPHFDDGECAYIPHAHHVCEHCSHEYDTIDCVISNPIINIINTLKAHD